MVASPEFVPDIVLSEIHYHPRDDDPNAEYIEIENRGATEVDLGGWLLLGGVHLLFPPNIPLPPGETIILSPAREATIARYGLDPAQVVGDWNGRLDNGGEILDLVDASGRTVFRTHYRDRDGWPRAADGFGSSLELRQGAWDPYLPGAWRASARLGGTPGEPTSFGLRSRILSGSGAEWSFFRGIAEPEPDGDASWAEPAFDDSSWEIGAEPFSHGRAELGTRLDDMPGSYTSLYTRLRFLLDEAEHEAITSGLARALIRVEFQGALVAYVNGTERFRAGLDGAQHRAVRFDEQAPSARFSHRELSLSGESDRLVVGENVVAFHALAPPPAVAGFELSATVRLVFEHGRFPKVVVNEVSFAGAPASHFIELYNDSVRPADLSGVAIAAYPSNDALYRFPAGTTLDARSWLAISTAELPFSLDSSTRSLLLFRPDVRVLHAFALDGATAETSFGRVPDGADTLRRLDQPSPAAPNRRTEARGVVLNEIYYHPPEDDPPETGTTLELIELHNPTAESIALAGYRLRGGVSFDFPSTASIDAGGYLVLAVDPEAVSVRFDVEAIGPIQGRLANDEDEIVLEDASGDIVASVRYFDEGSWSREADGLGSSLELVHPGLDPSHAASWTASGSSPTPGAPNRRASASFNAVTVDVRHLPAVPSSTTPVIVTCRVLDTAPPAAVRLEWTNDTNPTNQGELAMNDAGDASDRVASDGVYTATIPPQSSGSTVRFAIVIDDADGALFRNPRSAVAYYLYEVNDRPLVRADVPHATVLFTRENAEEIRRNRRSGELYDGTFIDPVSEIVRYNVGVRYRGNGSLNPPDDRFSYRVRFKADEAYEGLERLNFNSQNAHRQVLGNRFFAHLGLPYPATVPIVLRAERGTDVRYARVEAYDGAFLQRFFGEEEAEGNLYRGLRDALLHGGENPSFYKQRYEKETNEDADDWSDLFELTRTFTLPAGEFVAAVESVIDTHEWIDYFAAQGALGNIENSINLDAGDDYFLYARPSDGRFLILPWDSDSVCSDAAQPLFRPTTAGVRRLLGNPAFAPRYWCVLEELASGLLTQDAVERELVRIVPLWNRDLVAPIQEFVNARSSFLESSIPRAIAIDEDELGRTALIAPGDTWAYWPGRSDPSGGDTSWILPEHDDAHWPRGPSGFGYGDNDDATVLDDMRNNYGTVFARHRFHVDDPSDLESLTLEVDYDDGFAAWLNGTEIARRNYASPAPRATDIATRDREAGMVERFPIEDFASIVRPGENVLAVVGLNGTLDSSDMSLIPALIATFRAEGACDDVRRVAAPTILLSGVAPGCGTSEVRVGGVVADYDTRAATWSATVALDPGRNEIEIAALDFAGREIERMEVVVEREGGLVELSGRIAVQLDLQAGSGPFRIGGETTIAPGARVTFGPGCVIILGGDQSRLVVEGVLELLGTKEFPVEVRSASCGPGGILFRRGVGSIKNVVADSFSSLTTPLIEVGGDAEVRIESSSLADLEGVAIRAAGSSIVEVLESSIERATTAISVAEDARVTLAGVAISDVGTGLLAVDGATSLRTSEIRRAEFAAAITGGAHLVDHLLLADSDTGLDASIGAYLDVRHLTVAGNQQGIVLRGAALAASQRIADSIIWQNGTGLDIAAAPEVEIRYSIVQDATPPGPGNLSIDPRFVDATRGDYRLAHDSPAAFAAEDGGYVGAYPALSRPEPPFIRGDADANGDVNLSDAITVLHALYLAGAPVACDDAADATDDGELNLTDPIRLLDHLFLGGPPLAPPYPNPGIDPTPDALGCDG